MQNYGYSGCIVYSCYYIFNYSITQHTNKMQAEPSSNSKLKLPPSEHYYLKGIQSFSGDSLMKMQTSHIMVLFFFIGGLHILQKQSLLDKKDLKQKLISYILSLQLPNGGFTCSTLYSQFKKESKYQKGHIVFTYSALNCLQILNALHRVDKAKVLATIGRHQKQDGSFSSFENSTESDLRFVYSALSICKLFGDFSHIDKLKAKEYIDSCYNFDGGYGLRPKDESHNGAIYCAVASYQHLNFQYPAKKKFKTIQFLVNCQTYHEDQQFSDVIGIQGRVGKSVDSCYSFWAGASLQILTGRNLLNPEIEKFILKCYKEGQANFSKHIQSKTGDPVHTFHAITGLKILHSQVGDLSLSSLLRPQSQTSSQPEPEPSG